MAFKYHRYRDCYMFGMTRLLIVEDSDDVLFILKTELEWRGYAVDVATDGKRAIEIARLIRPDLIISDLRMPGIDGFEFIRRVRQIREMASVPAIALTGFSMNAEVNQAIAFGFTAHLTKPVDMSELMKLITRLTEKKFQRQAS